MLVMTWIAGPYRGTQFELVDGEYVLGSAASCNVRLSADPGVSESHLRLIVAGGTLKYEDMGSLNGTFVNGARVRSGDMALGDQLQIGASIFTFAPAPVQTRQVPGQTVGMPTAPLGPHPGARQTVGVSPPTAVAGEAARGSVMGWVIAGLVIGVLRLVTPLLGLCGIFSILAAPGGAAAIGGYLGIIVKSLIILAVAGAVHSDLEGRHTPLGGLPSLGWAAMVLLFWPLGVVGYLVLRSQPDAPQRWPVIALKVLVVLAAVSILAPRILPSPIFRVLWPFLAWV
jgi:hypothetical protein